MEQAHCPINNNPNAPPFLKVADRLSPAGTANWQLVRDPESSLIYLSPRPDETEITAYYPALSYAPFLTLKAAKSPGDILYLMLRKISLQWKASLIDTRGPSLSSDSKILEIGCSTGELLDTLRRKSRIPAENCLGFEKDRRSASHARETFGISVQTTDFCDSLLSGRFDRIIFWHTLEHIHRINDTLEKAVQHLGKNGVMVIALPNAGSFDATLYGKHWVAWDAPRHLYHFTPETLGKLLNRHGLEITSMHPFIPDTFYNCIYSERNISREKGDSDLMFRARGIIRGIQSMAAGARNNELSSTLVYTIKRTQQKN